MSQVTGRRVIAVLGAALAATLIIPACGGSITPNPLTPTVSTITTLPSDTEMLSEKTLGTGPITITQYVSFACASAGGACSQSNATFYLTGEGAQIKAALADTGKAVIQFRNLLLGNEPASTVLLSRCAGNAHFFDAVQTIFQNQSTWLSGGDTAIQAMMLRFGMSQSVINSCLADSALSNGLGQIQQNALQANYALPDGTVRSTTSSVTGNSIQTLPALVVNGVLLDGKNNDGTDNPAFAATLANVQALINK